MKRFRNKITIAILTITLGVFAVWVAKYDQNIYPIEFSTLMRESKNYDWKIVEIKVSYVQGYEASFLTDSNRKEFITATYFLGKELCREAFDSLQNSLEKQEETTVIGRYHDSEYQQYDGYVHTIEILEVKPTRGLQTIKSIHLN